MPVSIDTRGYTRRSEGAYWILLYRGREVGTFQKCEGLTLAQMVAEAHEISARIASGDVEYAEAS